MTLFLPDGTEFLIDDEDIPKIFNQSWHIFHSRGKIYIRGWDKKIRKKVFIHRVIMSVTDRKDQVDHINGDTLDNRKQNLRVCNNSQNTMNRNKPKSNTSGFKGVSKSGNKWMANIRSNGIQNYLGTFLTKEDAAKAYNEAVTIFHGEFGVKNVI